MQQKAGGQMKKKLKFVIYICSYCGFETEYPKGAKSVTLFCPKCHEEKQFVETKKEAEND